MKPGWILVLDPPSANAARRVGGVPLVLRLALGAQAGSAGAISLTSGAAHLRTELHDPRLRIPVLDGLPLPRHTLRIRASYLVHPRLLAAIAEHLPPGDGDAVPPLEWPIPSPVCRLLLPDAFDPIDVVDASSAHRAELALFETLRKPDDGWTARWLNRRVSLRLSRLLVRTPLRPNDITLAVLTLGLVAAWLASRGTYGAGFAGAGLFQAQSILDGCDGEISRVTYRGSLFGAWLDTIGDDITTYGFFLGAAWGLYRTGGDTGYLVAGAIIVIGGILLSGIQYRYLLRIGSGSLLEHPMAGVLGESRLLTAVRPLFRRDTFILLTLVAAGLDLLGPMTIVIAVSTALLAANAIRVDPIIRGEARGQSVHPG